MNLLLDLAWRGMVQDTIPGTSKKLDQEKVKAYIGFDPTSDSLHVGSLLPIMLLAHLQRAGHVPVILVGGATALVGDPSGKTKERILLDTDTIEANLQAIKKQLSHFLDFSPHSKNQAIMLNNYDWFKKMKFLTFIRDTGKHFTVNYMTSKDSVQKRLSSTQGMSFTEFSYQLVQAYDFYWLYTQHQCSMQMGGSDQWGNITAGAELIRRKTNGEVFGFTCPLIAKADGSKFGKSEEGNIWLDSSKTSPYRFYQFWINSSDEDAKEWIKKFTFLPKDELEQLIITSNEAPKKRILQKILATHITKWVHGDSACEQAVKASDVLFGRNTTKENLQQLPASIFEEALEGIPTHKIERADINPALAFIDVLTKSRITNSKGEARRLIENGGMMINKTKVTSSNHTISESDLLFDTFILINKGKKQYFLLRVV